MNPSPKLMNSSVFLKSRSATLVCALGLALVAVGCKDQSIRVYTVPKEIPKPAPLTPNGTMAEQPPTRSMPHLDWEQLPASWKEIPASAMRAASFEVTGADGQTGNVGAIPLPMMAGKELEFVNMWRADLELAETTTNVIAELREDASIAGTEGSLFDMISDEPLIDEKYKKRVVVGMASINEATWFFKLTGPDQLVAAEKQNFIQWLADVEVHEGSHGGAAPQMSTTSDSGSGIPQWTVPESWTAQQPGAMLLASFSLPGGDANVTVMSLGGDGGGLLPNINRWRGQIGLSPIDSAELNEVTEQVQTADGPGTLVDIEGNDQRLLAVIIPHQGRSWFYKSMGASEVVGRERDAFVEFARTAKH